MPDNPGAVRAFTADKVRRLTGLSARQLQYWDEQGFLSPSLSRRRAGRGRRRLYDFRDLVSLRVAADLRSNLVPLQEIRRAAKHLRTLDYEHPLSELRFWEVNGRLYFEEAGTYRSGRRPEQTIAIYPIPFGNLVRSLQEDIVKLDTRPLGQTEQRRGTLSSQRVIAGTRILVSSIQRLAADGADEKEILELYPDLTAADIQAALVAEPTARPRKRAS